MPPLATVSAPAPRAVPVAPVEAPPIPRRPAVMLVPPVKVLAPVSSRSPAPLFTSPSVPAITALTVAKAPAPLT